MSPNQWRPGSIRNSQPDSLGSIYSQGHQHLARESEVNAEGLEKEVLVSEERHVLAAVAVKVPFRIFMPLHSEYMY